MIEVNEERLYQILCQLVANDSLCGYPCPVREECDTKRIFMTDKDPVKLIMEYSRGCQCGRPCDIRWQPPKNHPRD